MINLETVPDSDLVAAWLDNLRRQKDIEHVGAFNRHWQQRVKMEQILLSRDAARPALHALLTDPDPAVVYAAANALCPSEPDTFRAALTRLSTTPGDIGAAAVRALEMPVDLAPPQITPLPADHKAFWSVHHPPPLSMTAAEIAHRLDEVLPDHADALLRCLRPAIGLWPQVAREDMSPDGSRLAGIPYAPPGWQWPVAAGEPMLFVGQINCADVHALPGADILPASGLLSFFADHDTAMGCLLTGEGGAVYYWPDTAGLVPAEPPLEILTHLGHVELLFRAMFDLPDPNSGIVDAILRDGGLTKVYRAFLHELSTYGHPEGTSHVSQSKLLGWPDLLQSEDFCLELDKPFDAYRLLLQLGSYTDGKGFTDWGPGGYLYYFLDHDAFAARRWEETELAMQCT